MKIQSPNIVSDRQLQNTKVADFDDYYCDNMLFQRNAPIPIRGFGTAGTAIRVRLDEEIRQTKIRKDGRWQVSFPKRSASDKGIALILEEKVGKKEFVQIISLQDIVIGDLWICAGQSNMEMGLDMVEGGREAAKTADDPMLRLLMQEKASSPIPRKSVPLQWKKSSSQTILDRGWGGFSALAWWFGKNLREELNIPIGIVLAAYGGASIHPFILPTSPLKGISKKTKKEMTGYVQEYNLAEKKFKEKLASLPGEQIGEKEAGEKHTFSSFNEYNTLKIGSAWMAMLSPLGKMPAKGFTRYQGESDSAKPETYSDKMKLLRRQNKMFFSTKNFIFVQIAPWTYGQGEDLPKLWQAQLNFAHKTGCPMVGSVDLGDMEDIHPVKKKELADRMTKLAMRDFYAQSKNGSGSPVFKKCSRGEESVLLEFTAMNGKYLPGLKAEGNSGFPLGFVGNWKNGQREKLTGRIDENSVLLDCPNAKNLSSIEYAFKQEAGGNVFNTLGEPAIPFKLIL